MKKLVVAIDFSARSLAALAHARALGSVELVFVARSSTAARRAEARLAELADGDAHQVRSGRLVDGLIACVRASGADAVVLGVPGRSASTARDLVRLSPVPVLFARRALPSRVVLAVDFSAASCRAIPFGFELAEERLLPLHLVHVAPSRDDRVEESVRSLARLALERDELGDAAVVLRDGEPLPVLLGDQRPGDLIVCGTNGHSRVEEVVFGGGVARKLVARAPGSVLVVGPGVQQHARPVRAPSLRAIRPRFTCTTTGCETALYADCARRGQLVALEECVGCHSFVGLAGQARGPHVVRCHDGVVAARRPLRVRDVARGLVRLGRGLAGARATAVLAEAGADAGAVIDERGAPCGLLMRADAARHPDRLVCDLAVAEHVTVQECAPVGAALEAMERAGTTGVVVLDASGRAVLGAVSADGVLERLRNDPAASAP